MALMDKILRSYFYYRQQKVEQMLANPMRYQHQILKRIIHNNRLTEYGQQYAFASLKSYEAYRQSVPVVEYEEIFPQIERMMALETKVLVADPVTWFARSSGTTNDRSKYIPVTQRYLLKGHMKCMWTTASIIYHEDPTAKLFQNMNLIMGGSLEHRSNGVTIGDISAILLHHFPKIGRRFATPDIQTALIADWDEKIRQTAKISSQQKVTTIGGVPTWTMVLIKEILHQTGAANLSEVWPDLKTYLHGGIGFEPYRAAFRKLIPSEHVVFREVYNASEGYFGIQNQKANDGVALFCNHEIFYEFIPFEEFGQAQARTLLLDQVELGQAYVIVISNSSGLYRYVMGDVVRFVSIAPYKIKVVSRTQQYINVFGEELMVANTDRALAEVAQKYEAVVHEYTVGPIYMEGHQKGGHEWAVEFIKAPQSLQEFASELDARLRELNSDYDAKRYKDMAMLPLVLHSMESGTIESWQRSKARFGNQFKLPRLRNDRQLLEELLSYAQKNKGGDGVKPTGGLSV